MQTILMADFKEIVNQIDRVQERYEWKIELLESRIKCLEQIIESLKELLSESNGKTIQTIDSVEDIGSCEETDVG